MKKQPKTLAFELLRDERKKFYISLTTNFILIVALIFTIKRGVN